MLFARLKCDVLGIPNIFSRLDRKVNYSRGESLVMLSGDISEIQIEKNAARDKYFHEGRFDYPSRNNYNSLTSWLNYSIDKGILQFYGEPSVADLGQHIIRIFNKDDIVVRTFGVEVLESEPNLEKIAKIRLTGLLSQTVSPLLIRCIKAVEMEPFIAEKSEIENQEVHSNRKGLEIIGIDDDDDDEEEEKKPSLILEVNGEIN